MFTNSNNTKSGEFLAVEIGWTELSVAAVKPGPDGEASFRTITKRWRHDAISLQTDEGKQELSTALKQTCKELRVSNASATVSLTGDFCVTRVASGLEDEVRHELAELERRSTLYLSLGYGPKALAASATQIDARHRHATMTVVHQYTLDAIVAAAEDANLALSRVEPALISLCRLVHQIDGDNDDPVMILQLSERQVEVGISHRGRLLLDYRPAGVEDPGQVAATLLRHLGRLQRYCRRFIRFASGDLKKVYVCGAPEAAAAVCEALRQSGDLEVHPLLDPWGIDERWQTDQAGECASMVAPVGAALSILRPDKTLHGPNLLERMQAIQREALSRLLAPLAWPLAASLLLIAGAWFMAWEESSACRTLEAQLAQHANDVRDARLLEANLHHTRDMLAEYLHITAALQDTEFAALATNIAQCLPYDTWLDSIEVNEEGKLTIAGSTFTEDHAFEFVRSLNQVPGLTHVGLDGTRPIKLPVGQGTQFNIHCELKMGNDQEGNNDESV